MGSLRGCWLAPRVVMFSIIYLASVLAAATHLPVEPRARCCGLVPLIAMFLHVWHPFRQLLRICRWSHVRDVAPQLWAGAKNSDIVNVWHPFWQLLRICQWSHV